MNLQAFLERRIDRAAAPLAVGDVLAIMLLLTVGSMNHIPGSFLTYVTNNPLYLPELYAPFLIGWVLTAPLVGAYSPGAVESAKASVPLVIRSWIPAVAIGLLLRAFVFTGGAAPVFIVIMVVLGMVALGGWRALYFKLR
ncbi:DUF3054 domain-containing protein [Halorubrum gandharaense]